MNSIQLHCLTDAIMSSCMNEGPSFPGLPPRLLSLAVCRFSSDKSLGDKPGNKARPCIGIGSSYLWTESLCTVIFGMHIRSLHVGC